VKRPERVDRLVEGRVIAIIRASNADEAVSMGKALIDANMPAIEVSLTTPDGLKAVAELTAAASTGQLIGAGTVLDSETARLAVLAGAQFLVSPAVSAPVIRTAHRYGAAALPGAATPTEVLNALEAGADLVKFFPAAPLGLAYMKAILAAIPQAPLVPTGGVDASNARSWLEAGAVAVAVGGALTVGDPTEITDRVRQLCGEVSM
jgi:2-dehydro-3-deoxyphosphogluconate aldolase / (4S)-4-hydroxy-2-oxoglutarate aldolase